MGFRRYAIELIGSWCRWRLWRWSRTWLGVWYCLW